MRRSGAAVTPADSRSAGPARPADRAGSGCRARSRRDGRSPIRALRSCTRASANWNEAVRRAGRGGRRRGAARSRRVVAAARRSASAGSASASTRRSTCAWTRPGATPPQSGWRGRARRRSGRSSGAMGKNGLLNRLQRRLLLLGERGPVTRTGQLADLVGAAVRTREPGKDPATRTFQAVRIHVNQELEELSLALPQALSRCWRPEAAGGDQLPFAGGPHRQELHARPTRARARLPERLPLRAARAAAAAAAPRRQAAAARRRRKSPPIPRARSAVLRVAEKLG